VIIPISEITAWAEPAAGGWQYLFSPAYRAQKHADWRHEHFGYVFLDFLGGIIDIGVTLAIAIILGLLIAGLLPD